MHPYFKEKYRSKTLNKISRFFDNMNLPVPEDASQCTKTTDGGMLVFLNKAACVIRVTNNKEYPALQSPHILQPIFSQNCGVLRAEIFPGIQIPATQKDVKALRQTLANDNINLWDNDEHNVGYLAHTNIPIVIDQGAFKDLSRTPHLLKKALSLFKKYDTGYQKELYAPLINAFAQSWPAESKKSNKANIQKTWELCARMKKQGLLVDSWNYIDIKDDDVKNITTAIRNYNLLIEQRTP